jgi:hypothetical protein
MFISIDLKRTLLCLLIGSVILGALFGIWVVIANTWKWWEVRVVLTTVTIAIASFGGLACELSRTKRRADFLPIIGMALSLIAAGLVLTVIWFEPWDTDIRFINWTISSTVFAIATVHVCLLSLMSLASRFRWVMFITILASYGLALLITLLILSSGDNSNLFRLITVVLIVVVALTLVIPLMRGTALRSMMNSLA